MQPCQFNIVHMAGKTNPADVLSQLPLENQLFQERNIAEEYINYVTINAVPKTFTFEEIASVTKADPILPWKLARPKSAYASPYYKYV